MATRTDKKAIRSRETRYSESVYLHVLTPLETVKEAMRLLDIIVKCGINVKGYVQLVILNPW